MKSRICYKCKKDLPLSFFSKNKKDTLGYQKSCKECFKAYYTNNKKIIIKRAKIRNLSLKGKTGRKEYYKTNKKLLKEKSNNYYASHKEQRLKYISQYRKENKEKVRKAKLICLQRYRKNPLYRIRCNISRSVNRALKNRGSTKNGQSFFKAIGYTAQDLILHISKQFSETMAWENYGKIWELDHIIPQVFFNYSNMTDFDFKKCWALNNLRPLPCNLNRKLGGSLNNQKLYKKRKDKYGSL